MFVMPHCEEHSLEADVTDLAKYWKLGGPGSAPPLFVCRHCGGTMSIVETFGRPHRIRAPPIQPGPP
jgi:hypothetical protein